MTIIPNIVNLSFNSNGSVTFNSYVDKIDYSEQQKTQMRIMIENLLKNKFIYIRDNIYLRKYGEPEYVESDII